MFEDLIFDYGVKLMFCYYVYLKILEGCNYCCMFCIIFFMCGDFVSCLVGNVFDEVKCLKDVGVKELLVIL